MKKVLLLVVALAALALPASASASAYDTWTANGNAYNAEEAYYGEFTGKVGFTRDWYWGANEGSFYCDATVTIRPVGGEEPGSAEADIVDFYRDPSTCSGTGHWTGKELEKESINIGAGWDIDLAPSTPLVTKPGSNLNMTSWYKVSGSWTYSSETNWVDLDFVPTVNGAGEITSFMLEGMATDGVRYEVYGPFTPSGGDILGLQ